MLDSGALLPTHVNYVDGIVLGIMLISLLFGFLRGFTREVLGLMGWSGALFITLWGQHYVQGPMRHWIGNPFFADLTTIIILFITSLFLLLTLSRALSQRIKSSVLGGLDRSLGVIFGLGRGLVICVGLFLLINQAFKPYKRPPAVVTSRSYPVILKTTAFLARFVPDNMIPPSFYHPHPSKEGFLDKIIEPSSEDIFEAIIQPKPFSRDASFEDEEKGYGQESRQDMERLFSNYSKKSSDK